MLRFLTTSLILATLAAVLVSAAPARAADARSPSAFARTSLGVEMGVGLGAPLGLFSASLDFGPVRWFALSAGAGVSMFGSRQLAVTPRLRFPTENRAFALGVGLSTGNARSGGPCLIDCPKQTWEGTVWANPEVSYEKRLPEQGASVRLLLGVQIPTKGGVYRCAAAWVSCPAGGPPMPPVTPYLGVAFGWYVPRQE